MARRKIGLDMDGVLANFVDAFKREAEATLGKKLEGPSKDWGFSNWMTEEEQKQVWTRIKASKNWFYAFLGPMPGVATGLKELAEFHDLYFISTRIETAGAPVKRQTEHWLDEIGVQFPTVIITKDKGLVCKALGIQYFIDDKPENLEDIAKESPSTKLYLQDASYNKEAKIGTRVPNFLAFVDEVL